MRRFMFFFVVLLFVSKIIAQPSCYAFMHYGDTLKYKACVKAEESNAYYQFSKEFQEILDASIRIDSTFAYAYREKSVAYLKSGNFLIWKKWIDKAVKFNPKDNLGYRGWCRYQFFRDYKGAIKDIEELDSIINYDIGYSANGYYHLNIAKALCYKAIGEKEKAIKIIEKTLENKDYSVGIYDYLHLGVLYLETKNYEKAKQTLEKQRVQNNIAENQFYLALVFKYQKKEMLYIEHLNNAKDLYVKGQKMFDPYTNPMDKIYLDDIETELINGKIAHTIPIKRN